MSAGVVTAKINLAPEVYQNSQRDKRRRRLALTLGTLIGTVALLMVVAAGVVYGAQTVAIKLLRNSIAGDETKLQNYPGLIKAATAQEHLTSWQQLNQQKVFISRFFDVLQQSAPQGIAISNLSIDNQNNLDATGTSQTYTLAAKFAQALAAYNVQIGNNASPSQQPYFTNVQIKNIESSNQQQGIDFELTTQMSSQVTTPNGN